MLRLSPDEISRIEAILMACASWETVGGRENFTRLALIDLEKSDELIAEIDFSGARAESARAAVYKIYKASNVYFRPFLKALTLECFDAPDTAFIEELLSRREGGGAEVPPDIVVHEIGRLGTLGQIGAALEQVLIGDGPGVGVVLFQGDVELDCTPGYLIRLRWDQNHGVPLYITREMRCWGNWDPGQQVELTSCYIDGDADPDGSKRAQWCLEELMKRFSRPEQRRRGEVTGEFLRLVKESDYSTYFLVHTIDTSEPIEGLEAFLRSYLRFWKSLDPGALGQVRLLTLIRVDTGGCAPENLRAIEQAVRAVEALPATNALSFRLVFLPRLEDVKYRDARLWVQRLQGTIDKAQLEGELESWEAGGALKEQVHDVVQGTLFPEKQGEKKMGEVEPVLRRAYDLFRRTIQGRRQHAG